MSAVSEWNVIADENLSIIMQDVGIPPDPVYIQPQSLGYFPNARRLVSLQVGHYRCISGFIPALDHDSPPQEKLAEIHMATPQLVICGKYNIYNQGMSTTSLR